MTDASATQQSQGWKSPQTATFATSVVGMAVPTACVIVARANLFFNMIFRVLIIRSALGFEPGCAHGDVLNAGFNFIKHVLL